MDRVRLRNGLEIPRIGLGTWQITDRSLIEKMIANAYETGYRLFDTAAAYSNEISIAKAVREAGIPRTELVLSDKVWNTCRGYLAVQDACKKSLKKLKTDYLDMYLIHWPASIKVHSDWAKINADTWRGMEALYKEGLVRAIGVCNFKIHHLEELKKSAEILPFLNQVECHPGMNQRNILEYCTENHIQAVASSPLGNGKILENERLMRIAEVKNMTTAQVCIRWGIQKGVVVIPKTKNVGRLRENIEVYDFELSDEEMEEIDRLPCCGGIGIDPDEVVEFG